MSKEEAIKIDNVWYNRNPVHEINADTGKDMFDGTMIMCMSEYAEQKAIAFAQWKDSLGVTFYDFNFRDKSGKVVAMDYQTLYQLFKQQP